MRKLSFILLLLLVYGVLLSQQTVVQRQLYADFQKYHFGFHIGIHWPDFFLANNKMNNDDENWVAGIPRYSPGISVGIFADRRINTFFSIRFSPTIHLGTKKIICKETITNQSLQINVSSGLLQFPFDIKYASLRLNNYRPYLIGGIYGAVDLGGKIEDRIQLRKTDYGVSIGAGCDFYLYRIKICPELRFYVGFPNLWNSEERFPWSEAILKAKNRLIVLTFNFE